MGARRITLTDVSNVTGVSRHRLRNILNELPEFNARQAKARIANVYSKQDLIVIAICVELENRYGLRRDVVASLSTYIRQALSGPKVLARETGLQIMPWQSHVEYCSTTGDLREGIVFTLNTVLERVDTYLLDEQRPLNLAPVSVPKMDAGTELDKSVVRAKRGANDS